MRIVDRIYIDGAFVTPHGEDAADLFNPATGQVIGRVVLGDLEDTGRAIAAAKRAFPAFSRTTKAERTVLLQRLHDTVAARVPALVDAMVEEYGGPVSQMGYHVGLAPGSFLTAAKVLQDYDFTRTMGSAEVSMEPLGVVGVITPWNSSTGFICGKLAYAVAAGCTVVIKPSEMSALQTDLLLEALHEAGLPPGVLNVVNGLGSVVGAELASNPDVAKISFTGSTAVGKSIVRAGAETLKRVTLELGGKSPMVILDDADFASAVPLAIQAGIANNGQACIAGTRILVPRSRLDEFTVAATTFVEGVRVGDPTDPATTVGPLVSQKQWERVQGYITRGIEEGARVLVGGPGKPAGLEAGYYVKPTLFAGVTNDMTVAREEIFGPVLSIIAYGDEEDAIRIANDTTYGLQAYVIGADAARARRVGDRLQAGRIQINGLRHEPLAPFGGFKQSGLGREMGVFGLEAHLEPRTVLA
jgi:aldehyde dehydrogenase (NAD+)